MAWEGLNRRQFPRANFPCLIKIFREGHADETILTHTENISIGGACVIMKNSIELFTPAAVEIDIMDGSETIACRARVVWAVRRKAIEERRPSCYDVGFEFLDIKEQDRSRVGQAVAHLVRFGHETSQH
jgi:c-di-GMP-binding flagellar brake protein YcgR